MTHPFRIAFFIGAAVAYRNQRLAEEAAEEATAEAAGAEVEEVVETVEKSMKEPLEA